MIAVVIVVAAGLTWWVLARDTDDCATARQLNTTMVQFNREIDARADAWQDMSDSEYETLAEELSRLADSIDDATLAGHARTAAEAARGFVELRPQLQGPPGTSFPPPGPVAEEYEKQARSYDAALAAMNDLCPM